MSRLDAPIGVFDSGLGGLTVVRRIQEALPHERVLYVADQTHVPYGGRELAEVRGFAFGISQALHAAGCKALVMACNISSAVALASVQAEFPDIPVLGVILPGASAAAARTRSGRIGVLATAGTVRSGAYTRALHGLDTHYHVCEVACPAFVPLVEAGALDSPAAAAAAIEYLHPLCAADVDTVILGCTHYPFLLPILQKIAPHLDFIDPAQATVTLLSRELIRQGLKHASSALSAPNVLTTTGEAADFARQLRTFLPNADVQLASACWHNGQLTLPSVTAGG